MHRREFFSAALAGIPPRVLAASGREPETYVYKTVPGCEVKADVYRSSGRSGGPVFVWVHGGGMIFGSRKSVNVAGLPQEGLLKLGYTLVFIDYRLAPETKLPGIVEDLQDAYRWIRNEGGKLLGIDPDRIVISGGSAGAALTLIGGFRLEPRPRALIAYYGHGDIASPRLTQPDAFYRSRPLVSKEEAWAVVGKTPISEPPRGGVRRPFLVYCRQQGLWSYLVTGRDPAKEAEWFDRYRAIRNVTRNYPPTLLIHGTADRDVPIAQAEIMAEKLTEAKVPHELIRVPGATHGLKDAKPDELAHLKRRVLDWVQMYC